MRYLLSRLLLIVVLLAACAPPVVEPAATTTQEPAATKKQLEAETAVSPTTAPATRTATVQPPQPSATPFAVTQTSPATAAASCERQSPSLLYVEPDTNKLLTWNLGATSSCPLHLSQQNVSIVDTIGETIFFSEWTELGEMRLIRHHPDGSQIALQLPPEPMWKMLPSENGRFVAWNAMSQEPNSEVIVNTLYVTDLNNGETTELVSVSNQDEVNRGEGFIVWVVNPVRFTENGLLYTIAPDGKGGGWGAYTGKYSNLFEIPLTGGDPNHIYHCLAADKSDCIGDISPDNQWIAITDKEAQTISVIDFAGNVQHTVSGVGANYIGMPAFNAVGQLAYLSATIDHDHSFKESWVSVVDYLNQGEPTVINRGTVANLQGWYDNEHLIVWPESEPVAVMGMDGTAVSLPENSGRTVWLLSTD